MQPIRCKLCGHMAIGDTRTPPTPMPKENIPKFREGDRRRQQRYEQIASDGVSLDEIGSQFEDECGNYAHDYENMSFAEMSFGGEIQDYLGRWPTRTEIRVAVRAAREVSERDTPKQARGSVTIGGITDYAHLGDGRSRQESEQQWREARLELWIEMMKARSTV